MHGTDPQPFRPRRRAARRLRLVAALAAFLVASGASAAAAPAASTSAAPLPPLPFDHILRYDELTRLLHGWAAARPQLVDIASIGKTPGGRELWFLTITNTATGPAAEKPALLVDGHMHAIEGPGNVAALNFIWRVLQDYGRDERVTRLLDTRTIYVLPRVTPDGVEEVLRDGRIIRSAIRPAPNEKPESGLRMRDLDGDGRIVFMRYRDPNGPFKAHPTESRLLVPRQPGDTGTAEYWRVVPEGTIDGYDGTNINVLNALSGVDFGVYFPDDRDPVPAGSQTGPDPSRVPEIAAYAKAIVARPNIVAHVTCHSFGGSILMPPVNFDEHMPAADRLTYDTIARKGVEFTGYDAMTYMDLRAGQNPGLHIATEIAWLYNRLGIYSFITEFWNPLKAAGIKLEGPMSLWLGGQHPLGDDEQLLRWSDTELGGKGFVAWHAYEHPQLGKVEIGGWDKVNFWYNVPFSRLQQEVAPHADWLIEMGLSTPRLAVRSLTATPDGKDTWRVRAVIENTGWLPTNVSQQALDARAVGGVNAELELPAQATLVEGERTRDLGQLMGVSVQRSISTWWGYEPGTPDRASAEWLVRAPAGATVSLVASQPRAGTVRAKLTLRR